MELLEKILPSILTAIVASYLTARLSLRKFYSEKWWDKKERAYTEIIESLYDLLQYCEIKKEDYGDGTKYSEERLERLRERHNDAIWKIKRVTAIGAFVISPESAEVLMNLIERPRLNWESNPPWEVYEEDYKHYKAALESIRVHAKNDLRSNRA
ncbi:hypothetical protein EGT07_26285 [Herbaspirillum sp. HC18]|nr:hypothetical protein EGT07_26285 [Herbaspirillum sp. HC18]